MSDVIRATIFVGALAGAAIQPAVAQEARDDAPPEGWLVRTDRGGHGATAEGLVFVDLPPGFHITTGPAAIFYHPDKTASGSYRLEAETFLFDPGDRREGYGILFGGTDLDGDRQAYAYFLIRQDGRYLIKRRDGSETETIQAWTDHAAIVAWDAAGEEGATVKNVLAVEVGGSEVMFYVNEQEVARVARASLSVDGVAGLRINHGVNIHVARLDVKAGG